MHLPLPLPGPCAEMRILHLVSSINPSSGGPTEAIRMLVEHAPMGFSAEVVTLDDPAAPFLKEMPCPVHAFGNPRGRWFSVGLLRWLAANRHRFDGAVVHGLWQFTGIAAALALAGRLPYVPYVVFVHGMLDPYFKREFPLKHIKKWIFWIGAEYWVLRLAARVLFTTAAERDLAAQSFRLHRWTALVAPLGTVPLSLDPDTAALREAFFSRVPDVRNRRFLLFLGRLDPKKGCDLLLTAFAAIAPLHPSLHLVVAGPDPRNWAAALQDIAAEAGCAGRVHWPGMLRGDAKFGAFAACEAFILPSHQENFGIAAVEALASGKPVLLADPVNIAPDLERAGCALVESDTVAGTRRLIERWLALPPAAQAEMGRRALVAFEADYDMRRNTESILRVFENLKRTYPQPTQRTSLETA